MDYEMKYKNALEWARQVMNGETGFIRKEVVEVFPELKESEDERIRKAIAYCIMQGFIGYGEIENVTVDACLAWLEKQGEQKSIDDLTQQEAMDIAVAKCFEQVDGFDEELDRVESFRIKKGEWYVCIHDFCNKAIRTGEIIQAEHDDTIRGFGFLYMENKYFRPAFENEKPQVDGFDAEFNALLKKYEHLSKKELQEPLEFYLGVVRDDLDIVREDKPKWTEEDDRIYYSLLADIKARKKNSTNTLEAYYNEQIDWLKSLKQRMEEQ